MWEGAIKCIYDTKIVIITIKYLISQFVKYWKPAVARVPRYINKMMNKTPSGRPRTTIMSFLAIPCILVKV